MAKKSKRESPNNISKYSLPERLKYLREKRNLTQAELAKKSSVSQSTIAQIESGKKDPSLSTVKKVAEALDVHIAILFASDDVHVFDMKSLKAKYKTVDDLNPTLFHAVGMVVRWAKEIGFIS